jgi:omega-hydroxy-beta-dihydromenaquinone-9 sulfotransferase
MQVNQETIDQPLKVNAYPAWSPRFWHGMRVGCWWRLLAKNGFRVNFKKLPIAMGVSFFTPINDVMAAAQWLLYERKIRETVVTRDPLFILGHWRSGTTLLHELLVTDTQFASPNTFQCFAPSHFLLSEFLMLRFGNFLLPKKRPMDEMEAGWTLPQEDEFALMNLGIPSPYLRIAFPQTQAKAFDYFDMRGLSETEKSRWCNKFSWFIKVLTYHYEQKQLVLKSPPHTGRVAELIKLFPNAKFIHLTRDPRKLFSSTMRLWSSLDSVQGLQSTPDRAVLKAYVTKCHQRMYAGFEEGRAAIPADRIVDIRYEDLVADPFGKLEQLYSQLQLGDFELVKPSLEIRLANHESYRPNQHSMDQAFEREVLESWSEYAEKYGYM